MDNALLKIRELQRKLYDLQAKKFSNDRRIRETDSADSNLQKDIVELQKSGEILLASKEKIESAPQKRKKEKKDLIISLFLGYIFLFVISLLIQFVVNIEVVSIFQSLKTILLISSLISSIVIPIEFYSINKKYPLGNLEEINKSILNNNDKIEYLKQQKKKQGFN